MFTAKFLQYTDESRYLLSCLRPYSKQIKENKYAISQNNVNNSCPYNIFAMQDYLIEFIK